MPDGFEPDERIQRVAEAYALDAVDFARTAFQVHLDGTDASVEQVETMLARLHDELPSARPDADRIDDFAKMFGSYLGEVHRRNHGGEWGVLTLAGQRHPGMRTPSGATCWPWMRARRRVTDGPEESVWAWYRVLVGDPPPEPAPEPPKPWWRRILGE